VHLRRHGLDPDRDLVLVKEGFSWPAFFFAFLWAVWHRLWVAALVFALAELVLNAAMFFAAPNPPAHLALSLALAAVIGHVANDFRRKKLDAQGFAFAGVVTGDDDDTALRRFLESEPVLARDLKT
jgi:hypothetical protein